MKNYFLTSEDRKPSLEYKQLMHFHFCSLTPLAFWLGTFLNPPKSSSALLDTCSSSKCTMHFRWSFIFSTYGLYFMPGSNFAAHLMRWKYQFPTVLNFSKKVPLGAEAAQAFMGPSAEFELIQFWEFFIHWICQHWHNIIYHKEKNKEKKIIFFFFLNFISCTLGGPMLATGALSTLLVRLCVGLALPWRILG